MKPRQGDDTLYSLGLEKQLASSIPSSTPNHRPPMIGTTESERYPDDIFDPSKLLSTRPSIGDAQWDYTLKFNSQNQRSHDAQRAVMPSSHVPPSAGSMLDGSDESMGYYMYERENRWGEVRKLSEYIQRYAVNEASSRMDLSKEKYYDLHNITLHLLRAVESLDPSRSVKMEHYFNPTTMGVIPQGGPQPQTPQAMGASVYPSSFSMNQQYPSQKSGSIPQPNLYFSPNSMMEQKMPHEEYYRGQVPGQPMYTSNMMGNYPQPQGISSQQSPQHPHPQHESPQNRVKSFSDDVFFDDLQPVLSGGRKKKPSSRRNLHCYSCGVTETPEWRRGPDGEHTLCNACGLHYAKSLKKDKEKKDKDVGDGRKHSIDMLLNTETQQAKKRKIDDLDNGDGDGM